MLCHSPAGTLDLSLGVTRIPGVLLCRRSAHTCLGKNLALISQDILCVCITMPGEILTEENHLATASCLFFAISLQIFVFKAFSLELMTSNMRRESLARNVTIASYI